MRFAARFFCSSSNKSCLALLLLLALTEPVMAADYEELTAVGRAVGIRLQEPGVTVTGFSETGNGPKAGLRKGDRILRINGEPVEDAEQIRAMAASGHPGVFLAFDRKVMLGCRAVKVRASGFSAFASVNTHYAAQVTGNGLEIDKAILPKSKGEPQLLDWLSQNVFLLKLTPGLNPAIFDMLAAMGYKGIVIEAFGLGGFNVLGKGLRSIRRAIEDGVSVVVTTQCLFDSADLGVYQVGNQLLELGVIQARDMTTEAAMTKLMWALGQKMSKQEIAALFQRNLAGEVTE